VEFIHEANIVEIGTGWLVTAGGQIADKRRKEPSSADLVIAELLSACDTRRLADQAAPSEKRLCYRNRAPVCFHTAKTRTRRWMFGSIFGLDGRESYRELRLEPLCCPYRLSRGTAPHERKYPRRKDRF
jgi:hypothetical protein